jgi:hypothetical protein
MTPPIDRETLESEFGPEELTTYSAVVVANIQHEPSARFLRDVGIPARPNPWFDLVDGTPEQVRALGDCYDDLRERWTNLPEGAEGWLLLGMVPYDDIALDGITGTVYCLRRPFPVPAGERTSPLRLRVGTGVARPRGGGGAALRADEGNRPGRAGSGPFPVARHPRICRRTRGEVGR